SRSPGSGIGRTCVVADAAQEFGRGPWATPAGAALGQWQCDEGCDDDRHGRKAERGGFVPSTACVQRRSVTPRRCSARASTGKSMCVKRTFASLSDARAWTKQFVRWYNYGHRHSGLKFVTPAQRHNGVANAVLAQREIVYAQGKGSTPLAPLDSQLGIEGRGLAQSGACAPSRIAVA
ncbi:conserved hypothetical protein, partial [Ricinus communis]